MFSHSALDSNLIQAYLDTDYHVAGETPTTLRVGVTNPELAALFTAHHAHACAFLTACNPRSLPLAPEENAHRQKALEETLKSRSLRFIEGTATHPDGDWPAEPSYLVFDLALESAKALASHFDQNAILWCGPTLVPELILLR